MSRTRFATLLRRVNAAETALLQAHNLTLLLVFAAVLLRIAFAVPAWGFQATSEPGWLAEAHRRAFGYGEAIPASSADAGAKSLFIDALTILLKVGAIAGIESGIKLVALANVTLALISGFGVYAATRLARLLSGERAEIIAAVLASFFPGSVLYSVRCEPATVAATFVVVSVWLAREGGASWRQVASGVVGGLAILLRWDASLLVVPSLVIGPSSVRSRRTLRAVSAVGTTILLGGLLDLLEGGQPFAQLRAYLGSISLAQASSQYHFDNYFHLLWDTTHWPLLVIAVGAFISLRRWGPLSLPVLLFLVAHCYEERKAFASILPCVPLLLSLAAAGLSSLIEGTLRPNAWVVVLTVPLMASMTRRTLTLRPHDLEIVDRNPQSITGAPFRGLEETLSCVGGRSNVCGVALVGIDKPSGDACAYLHKNIPLIQIPVAPIDEPIENVNYIVTARTTPPPRGFQFASSFGDFVAFARQGACTSR